MRLRRTKGLLLLDMKNELYQENNEEGARMET
jgi:hypothetical protein